MITIVYSTHKDENYNKKFKEHLLQTVELKDVQILEYQNNNQYSLSEIYNRGISESIFDIIVCCHNDIKLEKGWGKNLLKDFENNSDYSIIGKAGSCYFPESGVYWERMNLTMVGQVYHHPEGQKKWLSSYSAKLPFLIPVVTLDGLFIAFNKNKIKHKFDESIGRFHFYDHLFCLPNYLDGIKIGVTSSFEITHQSVGKPNNEFWTTKIEFLKKYGDKLPLDLRPNTIHFEEIKEKPLKNLGKIAIIILTKNKIDLLTKCIDSFYNKCNIELFDIFIADTGSDSEEKEKLKKYIKSKKEISLIEYDFYNFAKINNDVVKNHISKNYEFLLFCNNDIELKNNVIYEMLKTFKTYERVGTVGARLHYRDNTVQHNGIIVYIRNIESEGKLFKQIVVDNKNKHSYYNYNTDVVKIVGSTGALLMVKKELFEKVGMFNESYTECFEDVELNLKMNTINYINYLNGKCVAYHYESQTRDIDSTSETMINEYNTILLPFIKENYNKLKDKFYITNG